MRRIFRWITGSLSVAALAVLPQWAAAQTPAAADSWDLRRTSESCYLIRSFVTAAGKVDVRIQAFGPTTPYHVILHGPGLPIRNNGAEIGTIAFGDEAAAEPTITFVGKANELPMVVIPASLPRPHPLNLMGFWFQSIGPYPQLVVAIEPAAEQLFVNFPDSAPLRLELGPMAEEYTRLDACAQGLSDSWSRTASGEAHPVSEPQLLDREGMRGRLWFPPNLSMNRISGAVQLRMTVDTRGRVQDCVVQGSTGVRQFGEHSCDKLERWARFEPAKDAQGNPVSVSFRTAIMFIIYRW